MNKSDNLQQIFRTVYLFIKETHYSITGDWKWSLDTNHIFCSDVFISFPLSDEFIGIPKTIIYPEDVPVLIEQVPKLEQGINKLKFKVITSYGNIELIALEQVREVSKSSIFQSSLYLEKNNIYNQMAERREMQFLSEEVHIYARAEVDSRFGIWFFNTETHKTTCSDNIFLIYGLPPQSLNTHPNTFNSFIHPEDRSVTLEMFNRAYHEQLNLHMKYRIIKNNGQGGFISQSLRWSRNVKGEKIFSGTVQDISYQTDLELLLERAERMNRFYNELLNTAELSGNLAHWQLNLNTRKIYFSENYYNIYGIRLSNAAANLESLFSFVHPDDIKLVQSALQNLLDDRMPPNIEYRISRTDGKHRFVKLKSDILTDEGNLMAIGIIVDITFQKTVSRALKESEKLLKKQILISDTSDKIARLGNWIWDIQTSKITCSENIYRLLGYKPFSIELTQQHIIDAIHPDDKEIFNQHVNLILSGSQDNYFEFRIIRNGCVRHMNTIFKLLYEDGTKVFIGTVQDNTDEVELRNQLTERIRFADLLIDSFQDNIIVTDTSNNIIGWNTRCEQVYGLTKADVKDKNVFDILTHFKIPLITEGILKVWKGESLYIPKFWSIFTQAYREIQIIPLKNENNEVARVLWLIRDISAYIRTQEQLTHRVSFMEKILEASVERIIVLDRDMNVLFSNKKEKEVYGLEKEQMLGKNILELIPSFINDPAYHRFARALKGETIYTPVDENPSSTEGSVESYMVPVKDEQGQVTSVYWMRLDLNKEYTLLKKINDQHKELGVSQTHLHAAQQMGSMGSYEYDFNRGVLTWSPEIYHLYGLDPTEEISTEKALSYIHPDDLNEIINASKITDDKDILTGEYRIVKPFGEIRHLCYRGVICRNENGKPKKVNGIMQDITERKLTEMRIVENEGLLESVIDASTLGFNILKSIRNIDGKIVDFEYVRVDMKSKQIAGRETVGCKVLELYPYIVDTGLFTSFINVVETGQRMDVAENFEAEEANSWLHVTAAKWKDGLVLFYKNICECKKIEEEQRQSKQRILL